jgi:pimeloyl-ACP methyl ester carboxylesterase
MLRACASAALHCSIQRPPDRGLGSHPGRRAPARFCSCTAAPGAAGRTSTSMCLGFTGRCWKRSRPARLCGLCARPARLRQTPRDGTGWLTPRRAADDVVAVLTWIAVRHPTLPRPALLGWSTGAAVAHLTAATAPSRLSSLILAGYAPDPGRDQRVADQPCRSGSGTPVRAPRVTSSRRR